MRRAVAIFLSFLSLISAALAQDSRDSLALALRLKEYFAILESEPAEVKAEECDALIGAAKDSSLRRMIALKAYDHYKDSPLMGDEAVAIHLTDKWFSSGLVAMRSGEELFGARLFADSNRESLLGMKAPLIGLFSTSGDPVAVPGEGNEAFKILYFYDTSCAKCKLETATLRSLLNDQDYPIVVYAIYVGSDEDAWKSWRESGFKLTAEETEVIHLWDPEVSSGYQMKYGVLSTPKMFLIDPDGVIVGRGLDTEALETLLDSFLDEEDGYSYGGEASSALFGKLFSTYGASLGPESVADVATLIKGRTLDAGDTLSFKHLEGDLLYFLASRREEPFREGALPFIEEHVLSRPDIWNTSDDTLMVVGMADMLKGLLSKAPVGSRIPKMGIKGWNRFRKRGGYIFFHAEGCPVCEEQMALADSLGLNYFSVDMDALEENAPKKAAKLLDTFDLSALPFVIEIGKGGVVKRRYVSLVERLLFLDEKE